MINMDKHEKAFCRNFKYWFDTNYGEHGDKKRVASDFGVSPGQISNVIAGNRSGNEEWRRKVAKHINVAYDSMVDAKPGPPIAKQPTVQDKKIYKLSQTVELLTDIILADNESEKNMPEILNALLKKYDTAKQMERRVAYLEKSEHRIAYLEKSMIKIKDRLSDREPTDDWCYKCTEEINKIIEEVMCE